MNVRTGSGDASAISATTIGRVDPAREQRAERDVGDEPLPHRVGDRLAHALQPRLVRERLARGLRLPVALDPLASRPRRRAATRAAAGARRAARCARPGRTGARDTRRARRGPARAAGRAAPSSAFSSDANASVPSSSRVQTSGFLPSRSRASTSRPRGASQSAIANMPSSRSTKRGPYSSYRCGITGVSPRPRTSWPFAARSARSSGKLYSSPLKTATTSPCSFATGW